MGVPKEGAFFDAHVQVGIRDMTGSVERVRAEGCSFLDNTLVRTMNIRNEVK